MTAPTGHRRFKDAVYAQFARVGHAIAAPKRLELLDLLGQSERTVAELAREIATPVKNTSAHLRALRLAGLVETRRDGPFVHYRLASHDVHALVRDLESLAHERLADVERVTQRYLDRRDTMEPITARELERRMRRGDVTVIDVRPRAEYDTAHIPGALSLPIDDLKRGRARVPFGREVIAYCRGRYCVYAVEAVTLLRKHGHRARRLADGLPGWRRDVKRAPAAH